MPLIDAHMHLQEEVLEGHVPGLMQRAREAGVTHMVCNGTHPGDWAQVASLAREYPQVVPCFGLHPWFVAERPGDWLERLREWLLSMPSAVGEIGLDRWVEPRDEPAQEEVFRAQLRLAAELRRPVMIHCLKAWGWLLDVLREETPPRWGMLVHAFGGAPEMMRDLADMGAHFSFAGNALDPGRKRARRSLLAVPLGRLLVETDAPAMLPPEGFRPHVLLGPNGEALNEPANLAAILAGIADLRGLSADELAAITAINAKDLLGDLLCPTSAS